MRATHIFALLVAMLIASNLKPGDALSPGEVVAIVELMTVFPLLSTTSPTGTTSNLWNTSNLSQLCASGSPFYGIGCTGASITSILMYASSSPPLLITCPFKRFYNGLYNRDN